MSGTSMDGIDAALIATDGTSGHLQALGALSIAYAPQFKLLLKSLEYAVRNYQGDMVQTKAHYPQALKDYLKSEYKLSEKQIPTKISALLNYLYPGKKGDTSITVESIIQHSTLLHSEVVKALLLKTGYDSQKIDVIGYHGQTLFHRPALGISIVVGDGQLLAEKLQITVVSNFRADDVAAGGQGAPLAPLYHQALAVRDKKLPAMVVNCGGIANITFIPSANEQELIGFDTGPGNALVDTLIRQRTQGSEMMDKDGQYGKRGRVDPKILKALYEKCIIRNNQNYFLLKPPKSLDYGDMKLISELNRLSLEDACRTLEAFTADTIVNSLEYFKTILPLHWILTGGGWKNPVITEELRLRLQQRLGNAVKVLTADEIGWNTQAMEAQAFAYLAVRSLQNQPISFPNTTQVAKPLSGGRVYLAKAGATLEVKKLLEINPAVLSR